MADLPAARPAPRAPAATSSSAQGRPRSGRLAPSSIAALAGLAIAVVVLVNMARGGWGLIWLLLPALLMARRLICHPGASRRCGQAD